MIGPGHYFETETQELAVIGRMVKDFTKLKEHLVFHPEDVRSRQTFERIKRGLKTLTNGGLD